MLNVKDLIPHREPILMLHTVHSITDDCVEASATVGPDWPCSNGHHIDTFILIEAINQAIALGNGYKRKQQGLPLSKGWIVGIKKATLHCPRISVGSYITVKIKHLYSEGPYSVIEGLVCFDDEILLEATIQGVNIDDMQEVE